MSLRDPERAAEAFEIDPAVRRALTAWGKSRDSDLGRVELARARAKMSDDQLAALVDRLAEISLGILYVTLVQSEAAAKAPARRPRAKRAKAPAKPEKSRTRR